MNDAQQFYADMGAMSAEYLRPVAQGGYGGVYVLTIPPTAGTYNAATQRPEPGSPAVVLTVSGLREEFNHTQIDGTTVRTGDYKLMLSPLDVGGAPLPQAIPAGATLVPEDGGPRGLVMNASPFSPAGKPLFFNFHVRGA